MHNLLECFAKFAIEVKVFSTFSLCKMAVRREQLKSALYVCYAHVC